jgi:hypothetical protein
VIRHDRRGEKAGELKPPVAIRRAHHGNFDALVGESSNTAGPFSFNRDLAFELEAELAKEINRRCEIIDENSYVVHPFERHLFNLRELDPFWTARPSFHDVAWLTEMASRSRTRRGYVPSAQPTAGYELFAGQPTCVFGCKEYGHIRDIFRLADPAERCPRDCAGFGHGPNGP